MSCAHESRCTGHCCRRFSLPLTIEEIQIENEKALIWVQAGRTGARPRFDPEEIQKVASMVIPTDDPYLFNCKHHNAETGDCMNYENRPELCRDYPYGRACNFAACTWEEARNPPINIRRPMRKAIEAIEAVAAEPAA